MLQGSRITQSLVPISRSVAFNPLRTIRSRGCRSPSLPLQLHSERRPVLCQAESSNEPSATEGILDYALGQGTYQFVAAALGVLSISFLFAASRVAEKIYMVPVRSLGEALFGDIGALSLIPLAMCLSLQSAVESNRLDSPTYKRMSFTLALSFLAILVVKFMYMKDWNIEGVKAYYITSVVELLPTVAFLKLYGFSMMSDIIPGFISGVQSLFEPDNINSALYSLFSVVTMLLSLGAILKPKVVGTWFFTATFDFFEKFLFQQLGGLAFLLSIICFTLKDSADRDRLGFTTFRNLNIATFLACIGKIGTLLFVNKKVVDAAVAAAAPAAKSSAKAAAPADVVGLLTQNGSIAIFVIFGGLALLSGYNAITAKKE